jgi:hypothetical protein
VREAQRADVRETQKGGCERAADQIRLEKKKDKRNRAASRGNAEREEREERRKRAGVRGKNEKRGAKGRM